MLIFLGIVIGFWILGKLLRWWIIRKIRRQANSMFEQFANAAGASAPNEADHKPRKGGWQRAERAKKVSADEGEYVAFDEVTVSIDETVTDGKTTTNTHIEVAEQRIEDVEWEEI